MSDEPTAVIEAQEAEPAKNTLKYKIDPLIPYFPTLKAVSKD